MMPFLNQNDRAPKKKKESEVESCKVWQKCHVMNRGRYTRIMSCFKKILGDDHGTWNEHL